MVPDDDSLLRRDSSTEGVAADQSVELASPEDFIPVREGWEDRSRFIAQEGRLAFYDYDLIAQALSKIERGHTQDLDDVREMLRRGLVEPKSLRDTYDAIEPRLYRYPAVDPTSFRRGLDDLLRSLKS